MAQARDGVEAGDEKMKLLEQEMKEWGIFDTDFCLGDVLDEEEQESSESKVPKKSW